MMDTSLMEAEDEEISVYFGGSSGNGRGATR